MNNRLTMALAGLAALLCSSQIAPAMTCQDVIASSIIDTARFDFKMAQFWALVEENAPSCTKLKEAKEEVYVAMSSAGSASICGQTAKLRDARKSLEDDFRQIVKVYQPLACD